MTNKRYSRDLPLKNTDAIAEVKNKSSLKPVPSSPALYRSGHGLIIASDIENLIPVLNKQKAISGYRQKISYNTNKGVLSLVYETSKAVTTVNLDIGNNKKTSKTAYKFFRLFISLVNDSPDKRTAFISAREISKKAGYTRASSFNRAFDKCRDSIITMGISHYTKYKAKKSGKANPSDALSYFSRLSRTEDNNYLIMLNDQLDVGTIFSFFTCYKDYAYLLSDNAFLLYDNIMFLARQNIDSIGHISLNGKNTEALKFTVSISNICLWLGLPFTHVTNPNTQIKDPINKSLEEIEAKEHEDSSLNGKSPEMYITVCCRDGCGIDEYIKNGYVEIVLTGDYKEYFKDILKNKTKKRDKEIKKRESAKEKALIKQYEKKLSDTNK